MKETTIELHFPPVADKRTWFSELPVIDVLSIASGYFRWNENEDKLRYFEAVSTLAKHGWTTDEYLAEFHNRLLASNELFIIKMAKLSNREPNVNPKALDDAYYAECIEKGM